VAQALIWNMGTYGPDDKRKIQVNKTSRMKVSMQGIGTEEPVVVMKLL